MDMKQLKEKSLQLFPNNIDMAMKWYDNTVSLMSRNKHATQTGGWVVPGGEFMNDYIHSKFNNGKDKCQ